MREFLEDAHNHRTDGYGRAQAAMKVELPRRFYKAVDTGMDGQAYTVLLDGRPTRTPGKKAPVALPSLQLAQMLAAEWQAQGERIDARTMPLVRLINSALEAGRETEGPLRAEIANYMACDLLFYRAEGPAELVKNQEKHWDGALVALARHFGVRFQPTIGIIHQAQPEATLARLAAALEGMGFISLTGLMSITNLTGSGLLALGLKDKIFDPDSVWQAAHVDEDHNAKLWGMDPEAQKRRDKRRVEFDAAITVLELAGNY